MRRWLLLSLICAANAHAGETEQVFNVVRSSVVTITVLDERKQVDGAGSGVILAPGQVITNCHVVQEASSIRVQTGDHEWDATIALSDVPRDLCKLDVPGLTAPSPEIRSYHDIQIGEPAYAVGNPLGFGIAISAGLVSAIGEHKGQLRLYSSAPISPGSSGGGLFDSHGRLIGIVTAFYPGAQNLNLVLPADWIAELPKRGVRWHAPTKSIPDPDWLSDSESLRVANKWAELAALSRHWRESYPTSARANVTLGMALVNTQQYQEAKEVLLVALQQDPYHATGLSYLAQARYHLGEKEAAMADLRRAISFSPTVGFYYYTLALWQAEKGEFDLAAATAETAIKLDPGNDFNWELLGELRQRQKRYAEAVEAYRAVLRLKPNHPMATPNLAAVLAATGESSAARQVLTTTHQNLPGDAMTWLNVGTGEEKDGHLAEAERAYRKALEINPSSADAWYLLGVHLQRVARTAEAEEALRQAVKHKPDMAMAWVVLADLIRNRGDKQGAKETYEKATTLVPSSAAAWYGLGTLRRELGDYPGAVTALDRAVRLDGKLAAAWALLGEMQVRTGHADAALQPLQEAEKLDPKNENTLAALTMYYGMTGDLNKGLVYANRALELNSSSALNWTNKGYTLLKLGRYPEAIQTLETATRLQPDLVAAQINLGEAYLRDKQLGKAIAALQQALKSAPKAADARLYLAQAYAGSNLFVQAKEHLQIVVNQLPNLPTAWALMTLVNLSQGNQPDAITAYNKLKTINPAMARDLSQRYRAQNPLSRITLPD